MTAPAAHDHPSLKGLTVFERGWMSSNNVLIHPAPGEGGATLIDSSHVNHAGQTCALVARALDGAPLARIVNTHLHSDHCGGNAALQEAFGAAVAVAPGMSGAVNAWDAGRLTYEATGQRCAKFHADTELVVSQALVAGGRCWEVLASPGHDPDAMMLFDREQGVLVSADALWEQGFGVVFPEVAGEPGFDDVGAVLELIASLPVQVVIPGHGRPFTDVSGALERARGRLQAFRVDPPKHARHAAKVLLKYHLMEEGRQPWPDLLSWAAAAPLLAGLHERMAHGGTLEAWLDALVQDLTQAGVLAREGAMVLDANR